MKQLLLFLTLISCGIGFVAYAQTESEDETSEYCKDGKPNAVYEVNFSTIVPTPPKGIPVDVAGKILELYRIRNEDAPILYMMSLVAKDNQRRHIVQAVSTKSDDELLNAISAPFAAQNALSFNQQYAGLTKLHSAALQRTLLKRFKPFALAMHGVDSLSTLQQTDFRFTSLPSGKMYFTYYQSHLAGTKFETDPSDTALFDENVMIFPDEIKRAWFGPIAVNLVESYLTEEKKVAVDVPMMRALSAKDYYSYLYLRQFTTVKVAKNNDPRLTDYQLTVNLEGFCKYARPVNSLLSK